MCNIYINNFEKLKMRTSATATMCNIYLNNFGEFDIEKQSYSTM
jgi:hypothetical protein